MMILCFCTRLMLLGQIMLPGFLKPANPFNPRPPAVSHAAPVPKTDVPAPAGVAGSFQELTITRLFLGKETLTPRDLGHLRFWTTLVAEPLRLGVTLLPRLLVAIIFFLVFWGINRAIRKVINVSLSRAGVDSSIRDMFGHLVRWGVMGSGVIIALNQLGIQVGGLLAGASIVGLAIGFAAQETLANFIAGIVIFCDKPFRVGDIVNIDNAVGTIQRVTFRSTRMLTFDGEIVVLPNTLVLAHKLLNHSAHNTGRINISVGISYTASIDAARQCALGVGGHR